MHKCNSKRIGIIPRQSKIKRNSGRASVRFKRVYHLEFNDFACSLISSIRAEGMSEFQFRYPGIKAGLLAAIEIGARNDLKYTFSVAAPSVLAHEWLGTCALYGLIAPAGAGYNIHILLPSREAAQDYLDHMISQMRLRVTDSAIFRQMAQAYISEFKREVLATARNYLSLNQYELGASEYP